MPILNYTTKISGHKTVGEVQAILAKAGAVSVSVDYENGEPTAVTFAIFVSGQWVSFRLPSNWRGVLSRLEQDADVPARLKTEAQARRVAWRIIKEWVAAQMAIVDAQLASLPEVFLPYAVDPRTGETMGQLLQNGRLALMDGERHNISSLSEGD